MPKKAKKTVNVTHQSNSLVWIYSSAQCTLLYGFSINVLWHVLEPETPSDTSIYLDKNGNIVLKISAKPGAKSNGITGTFFFI